MYEKIHQNHSVTLAVSEEPVVRGHLSIGLLLTLLLLTLIPVLGGCSQCLKEEKSSRQKLQEYYYYSAAVSPKMILHSPAEVSLDPQYFAYRSDWPSAAGGYDLGQVTFYREYRYNRQNISPFVPDFSYNLFQVYRSGTTVR